MFLSWTPPLKTLTPTGPRSGNLDGVGTAGGEGEAIVTG